MGYVAAHVADGGDSVGDEKREDEFAAAGWFACAGEMDVHVGQARDQEFAGGVDDAGAVRDLYGRVWAYCEDFFGVDQDGGVWLRRGAGGVDYRDVSDGDGGGVGLVAGGEKKKKESE